MRPKTCKKYVLGGTNFFTTRRCRRTVFKDGLCKIHQPEAIREREKKREILQAIRERALWLQQVAYEPILICDGLTITDYDLKEDGGQ